MLPVTLVVGGDRESESKSIPPTLIDMGITNYQSSNWQALAAMTDDHFRTAIATAKKPARGRLGGETANA